MKSSRFSRRDFLGISAMAAGASLAAKTILLDPEPLFALPQSVCEPDRVEPNAPLPEEAQARPHFLNTMFKNFGGFLYRPGRSSAVTPPA